MSHDVIVVGGGTAGTIAAIQAGRAGARTLLVEKNGMLGGTLTVGGVNYPGLFHAWTRQVIAGIGWELVTRCVAESGLHTAEDAARVSSWGYTMALVGSALMRSEDPAALVKAMREAGAAACS